MYYRGTKKSRGGGSSQQKSSSQSTNKHMKDREHRPEKIGSRHGRNSISFHRRSTLTDDILQHEVDFTAQRISSVYNSFKTPAGAPPGAGLPTLRNTSFGAESVDSPHSAAPSPLVAPQITPSVNPRDSDPTMPTLSPHPPTKNGEKDLNSSMTSSNGDPAETSANNSATTNNTDMFNKQPQSVKQENFNSGYPQQNGIDVKQEPVVATVDTIKPVEFKGLKRPMLPKKNYDEKDEELITESLYDYRSLNDW